MKFKDTNYLIDPRKKFQSWMSCNENGRISSQPIELINERLQEWSTPRYRIADIGISSRNLNYLEETGLLLKEDHESGSWRKFSYNEAIYVLTIIALKKFGVKSSDMMPFAKGIMEDIYFGNGGDWFFPIFGVHICGIEAELFFSADGYCNLLGSELATRHYEGFEDGEIRIRLSSVINKFRKNIGAEQIKLNKEMSLLPLGSDETTVLHKMRELKPGGEFVKVKSTASGGTLIEYSKRENLDSETAKKLAPLVDEEFGGLIAQKEGGEVVSIQRTAKKFFPKQ